jgi:hypothetical protein
VFKPFSVSGIEGNPEAGLLPAVSVVSKGMSQTVAARELSDLFSRWADSETVAAYLKGRQTSVADATQRAWTDLNAMGISYLNAVRLNGYSPKEVLGLALQAARTPLYERAHQAMPRFPGDKGDLREMEDVARSLHRLNIMYKSFYQSIEKRDKRQHIERTGKLLDLSNELIREAFTNPYGIKTDPRLKQSADLGGDVTGFLATDEVPATVLGYKVLRTEELGPEDLKFFQENPEIAGHYDKAKE